MDSNDRSCIKPALYIEELSFDTNPKDTEFIKETIPKKKIQYSDRHPSKDLYVIGITGTNGKTSVSYLIGEVLKAAGYKPFVLGTLNSGNNDLSTPEAIDILRMMKAHLANGGTHFVMEVTSEGIDQARILGVDFNIKLLTNITPDHLDYHKTFENYEQVKLGFMQEGDAHKIYPKIFEKESIDFTTQLLGHYNLLNIKAAASVLRHIDIPEKFIRKILSTCSAPRGRLENVDKGQGFMVLVDYAHTPDGLQNVLSTLKDIALKRKGRLLVLFGCGGNRDRVKRPKMGKIACELADYLVITEDNPRLEDSQIIMEEILTGIDSDFHDYVVIQDRKTAIEFIIKQSHNNDVVILAGKGHETYQVLKSETIHFDDREQAENAILIRLKTNTNFFRGRNSSMNTRSFNPAYANTIRDTESESGEDVPNNLYKFKKSNSRKPDIDHDQHIQLQEIYD